MPNNPEQWLKVADEFENLWNFPHCIGAMDGKHVILQAPINSGTEFRNYKDSFSIVLFVLVDAQYNINFVDVGCQGRISDGGVFKNSKLYSMIENRELNLPISNPLPSRNKSMPYIILGDSAFALTENVMKPFPGQTHARGSLERVFNYRLSRARRVVENVFGIMAQVFLVFKRPLLLEPKKAAVIVLTAAHLHNYLRSESDNYWPSFNTQEDDEESLRNNIMREYESLHSLTSTPRRATEAAKVIRKEFADYFLKEGAVSFQYQYC